MPKLIRKVENYRSSNSFPSENPKNIRTNSADFFSTWDLTYITKRFKCQILVYRTDTRVESLGFWNRFFRNVLSFIGLPVERFSLTRRKRLSNFIHKSHVVSLAS